MLLKGVRVQLLGSIVNPRPGKTARDSLRWGCHSVSPPQNPQPGFVGSASPHEFRQLLLIKPALGSSACLPGTAMPLLPPQRHGE